MQETPRERRYGVVAVIVAAGLIFLAGLVMDINRVYLPGPLWLRALFYALLLFVALRIGYWLARRKDRAEPGEQVHS